MFAARELALFKKMAAGGINTPRTTSAGRLFDGVAALAGLAAKVSFEGQAAMAFEAEIATTAGNGDGDGKSDYDYEHEHENERDGGNGVSRETTGARLYPFEMTASEKGGLTVLDWRPMVETMIEERRAGAGAGLIAARFHAMLIEMIVAVARRAGLADIVLSGGCFQNRILLEGAIRRLRGERLRPWWPRLAPPNDGGIALGQAAAALWSER